MMKRLVVALAMALIVVTAVGGTASAQSAPHFVLGFKAIADQIPDIVGNPVENEWFNPSDGNAIERTMKVVNGQVVGVGMMVWRKSDNWTAFTDGYHTWVNGPYGLHERLNSERFPWENDPIRSGPQTYAPPGGFAAPTATPVPTAAPAAPPVQVPSTLSVPPVASGTTLWNQEYEQSWSDSTDVKLCFGGPSTLTSGPVLNLHFTSADEGNYLTVSTSWMRSMAGNIPARTPQLYQSLVGQIRSGASVQVWYSPSIPLQSVQAVDTDARQIMPGVLQWQIRPGDFIVYFSASSLEKAEQRPIIVHYQVSVSKR